MISVVLCDIDGTLVDSNDAHALAWLDALQAVHHPASFERVRALIGMGGDQLLPALDIEASSPMGAEAGERAGRAFIEKYLDDVQPFAGARELLERFHSLRMKVVAATSADEKEVGAILHHAGLTDLFERVTNSSDVAASKPAPDIVIAALDAANARAEDAVMLGDTPFDVASSRSANVRCVAFRCGGSSDHDLEGALEIHDGPAALLADWPRSIFGR